MRMVQSRVHGVRHQGSLVSLEEVDQAGLERLAVVVLHCECVCLVLGPTDEVHGDEVDDEADGHVDLEEEEQVEEV